MNGDFERRCTPTALEMRGKPGAGAKIVGYAAVYNQLSEPINEMGGAFAEQVAPSAFNKTLHDSTDVKALVNHEPTRLVGRVKNGSLRLTSDARGLYSELDVPDTSTARSLYEEVAAGLVDAMSFGFFAIRDRWDTTPGKRPERTLLEVRLLEVSYTATPAYPQTTAAARCALRSLADATGHDVDYLVAAAERERLLDALAGTWSASADAAERELAAKASASMSHVGRLGRLLDSITGR
jgi:uncharacterized protein